ncbi:hypothetical protein STEG23_006408 [Scotinomys teguina]
MSTAVGFGNWEIHLLECTIYQLQQGKKRRERERRASTDRTAEQTPFLIFSLSSPRSTVIENTWNTSYVTVILRTMCYSETYASFPDGTMGWRPSLPNIAFERRSQGFSNKQCNNPYPKSQGTWSGLGVISRKPATTIPQKQGLVSRIAQKTVSHTRHTDCRTHPNTARLRQRLSGEGRKAIPQVLVDQNREQSMVPEESLPLQDHSAARPVCFFLMNALKMPEEARGEHQILAAAVTDGSKLADMDLGTTLWPSGRNRDICFGGSFGALKECGPEVVVWIYQECDDMCCLPGDPECDDMRCLPGDPECDDMCCLPGDPECDDMCCLPGDPECDDMRCLPGDPECDDMRCLSSCCFMIIWQKASHGKTE